MKLSSFRRHHGKFSRVASRVFSTLQRSIRSRNRGDWSSLQLMRTGPAHLTALTATAALANAGVALETPVRNPNHSKGPGGTPASATARVWFDLEGEVGFVGIVSQRCIKASDTAFTF